jgi:hypothetical protein
MEVPAEGKAVMHAHVEAVDPFGIMPANKKCTVVQVDDRVWSDRMREHADNRIVVEPGLHWVNVEVDLLLADPSWTAFELEFQAGHEYVLAHTLTGCHALLGIGKNRVIPYVIHVADYAEGQLIEELEIDGICANAKGGIGCRQNADCHDEQRCVVIGKTGLGLCGSPSEKIAEPEGID